MERQSVSLNCVLTDRRVLIRLGTASIPYTSIFKVEKSWSSFLNLHLDRGREEIGFPNERRP